MTLNTEDRNEIVKLRMQKAKETMLEVNDNVALKHWRVAANRLYYACHYAVGALLISNGHTAHTYDDWATIEENDVVPYLEPAENFIKTIEKLILTK
ncbi:hypothetical protein AGMMS50239_03410 [Bacteroidia bacterium]|nr:hypothetical protein AGMMS50239_03410 [Bacteroidia bacterium]GHV32986.1 hypothetical protein FACS1894177_09430 [Bacteroidia bacterium]